MRRIYTSGFKQKSSTHHDFDHPVHHILQPTQESTGKPEENL
jgi:hypothetical protein